MKNLRKTLKRPIHGINLFVIPFTCLALTFRVASQPTSNPISDFYTSAQGYPGWTDEINWSNVYNAATYNYSACSSCSTNYQKFMYLRDIAYNAGGGVLYYPGGTYTFDIPDSANSEGLMLKSGVVIRGDIPTDYTAVTSGDINTMTATSHGLNSLPTKFVFTTTTLNNQLSNGIPKMWNCIGAKPGSNEKHLGQVNHIGIVYVEINYGYIWFGFGSSSWGKTWGSSGFNAAFGQNPIASWLTRRPDGTHMMDPFTGGNVWNGDTALFGTKRLVFGVNIKNGGCPNYVKAGGFPSASFTTEDGPWWFGSKIGVYGSYLLVANNVISKPTACFVMNLTCGKPWATNPGTCVPLGTVIQTPYDYGKGISFDINKNFMAGYVNKGQVDVSAGYYSKNVVVRDNWLYNHSNKGFDGAGNWAIFQNNVNWREHLDQKDVYNLKSTYTNFVQFYGPNYSDGRCFVSQGSDDFQARFMDLAGSNMWMDHNQYGGTGTSFDNSGEGIISHDHQNGAETYSWASTFNKRAAPSIMPGTGSYVGSWNSYNVGHYMGNNEVGASGWVGIDPFGAYCADLSTMNNVTSDDTTFPATIHTAGYPSTTTLDFNDKQCPDGIIPGIPTFTLTDSADFITIQWTDVANEAAYRIEKRVKGTTIFTPIAYRPYIQTGGTVVFATGTNANDIATSDGYPSSGPDINWDGKTRNMNPPVWRDYLVKTGTINHCDWEYRVVAVGCDSASSSYGVIQSLKTPVCITGLENKTISSSQGDYFLYPNPATGKVLVQSTDAIGLSSYRILSVSGAEVRGNTSVGQSTSTEINLSGIPSGIYILSLTNSGGQTYIKRLVVN